MRPIVALGGSAGGIAALRDFFAAMVPDSGMAFVVVLHLSPDHESSLAHILQKATSMPVVQVSEETLLEANHVYVIPPAKHLEISEGRLRLSALVRDVGRHVAVDLLFRSLAENLGPAAIAIVLSGADGDGCFGVKRIKECGGLTVAQDPDEAEQESMPRTAIATGMVDWVLPVAKMPERIVEYHRRGKALRLPAEKTPATPNRATNSANEKALQGILTMLQVRVGHDFSCYKRATVLRRIGRRMQVNGIEETPAYLKFLRAHPGEARALHQDLLISVTNFFRDPESFQALEAEIPRLFEGRHANDTVRVWVAACATGEEAYSVAMLLQEYADRMDAPPKLQVFATDLDDGAIQQARIGVYPETIIADVSPERLQRFFTKHAHGYRVQGSLREVVLFALHDLLKDPPFSRVSLITCRNLLIYLDQGAQRRALDVFHYALVGDGLLFLSTSESADEASVKFESVDKRHRLYVRRPVIRKPLPPRLQSDIPSAIRDTPRKGRGEAKGSFSKSPFPGRGQSLETGRPASLNDLHSKLREALLPPSLVVDSTLQIIHLSTGAERYLHLGSGQPTLELLSIVHPMLRLELRSLIYRVSQTRGEAQVRDVPLEVDGKRSLIRIRVRPAEEIAIGHLIVVFEETGDNDPDNLPAIAGKSEAAVRQLEEAFERLSAEHRDSTEQYAASNEELKSANEELQSRNEELRSATEELDTGREELQSINEELTTVNQELKSKVEELAQANADLANLMASTQIASIFLDRDLRILRYTPSAVSLFNFIPADAGRPLSDLAHRLVYPSIIEDAVQVLTHSEQREKEIRGRSGEWWLARMQPYRTSSNDAAGVVVTFIDITKRKTAEDDLRRSEAGFRQLADAMPQIVWAASPEGDPDYYNEQWYDFTGLSPSSARNEQWLEIVHPDDLEALALRWKESIQAGGPFGMEYRIKRAADGEYRWFLVRARPVRNPEGVVIRWLGTSTDISERKAAEESARASAEQLLVAMRAARLGTWEWDIEANEVIWSREYNAMFDLTEDPGHGGLDEGLLHVHPDDRARVSESMQSSIRDHHDYRAEMRSVHRDGSTHWIVASGRPIYDTAGKPVRMLGVVQDVTAAKEAEAALRESEAQFRLANVHSPFPIMLHADDGEILQINDAWIHQTGYSADELRRVKDWIERAYPAPEAQETAWQFLSELPSHAGAIETKGRRIHCADGSELIWDIIHASLGRLADGRALRITTAVDVTERYRDEVALRLAKEDAEKANRAKSGFLSRMSHELRTPLNAVLGFGQILAMNALGEREAQCVGHILTGGKHLLSLVDEVLDLAKVEAGELALKPIAIPLAVVLRESVAFVSKIADNRNITCRLDLRRGHPTALWADEQRFRQVLLNLLGNAIKYNRRGGKVTIVTRRAARESVQIGIRDTGPGIAPEDLTKLFTPFERLGQEFGGVEGTGLGLVVSKQLVEAMGGKLWAESTVGQGSTFWIELPIASAKPIPATKKLSSKTLSTIRAPRPSTATVLYIEDNSPNLNVVQTAIERLRPAWTFLAATSGVDGLRAAREHLPDLILLDLQLPGMKGDVVLRELRNDSATTNIPIVMLSADATVYSRERLLSLGATLYSSKPLNLHALLEQLEVILWDRTRPCLS